MRLPEDFFVSPRKLNNSVIPLSSHLNRMGLSFKAATAIDSSQQEENGGIEMTRLLFTTIAHACTTRADTQTRTIQSTMGRSSGFNCSGIIYDGLILWMAAKSPPCHLDHEE